MKCEAQKNQNDKQCSISLICLDVAFLVFGTFTQMMNALDADEVEGLFMDRLSGYHYFSLEEHSHHNLITSEHVHVKASVGLVMSSKQEHQTLTDCLLFFKSPILQEGNALASSHKVSWKHRGACSAKTIDKSLHEVTECYCVRLSRKNPVIVLRAFTVARRQLS